MMKSGVSKLMGPRSLPALSKGKVGKVGKSRGKKVPGLSYSKGTKKKKY
jgi:hypothetical protein